MRFVEGYAVVTFEGIIVTGHSTSSEVTENNLPYPIYTPFLVALYYCNIIMPLVSCIYPNPWLFHISLLFGSRWTSNTAGNRHKQNSWFCKEIREDNFRFWWRRVHEDASQGMYMSKIEIFFFTARILQNQRMLCCDTLAKLIVPRKTWRKLWHSYMSKLFLTKMQVKFSIFFHHGSLHVIGDKFRFVRSKLKSR